MIFLQQFDLTVTYKPGKKHTNANALSRATQEDDPSIAAIQLSNKLEITRSAQAQDAELLRVLEVLEAGGNMQDPKIAPGLHRAYLIVGVLCRTFQDSTN